MYILQRSSTALRLQSFKSGKVKTISPALAYSTPVAVQTTVTTAEGRCDSTAPPRQKTNSRLQKYRITDKGHQWLLQ
jgi:hypothetical protein